MTDRSATPTPSPEPPAEPLSATESAQDPSPAPSPGTNSGEAALGDPAGASGLAHPKEAAAWPTRIEEATAEALVRHWSWVSCRYSHEADNAAATGTPDLRLASGMAVGYFAAAAALLALVADDPREADGVARDLWEAIEAGQPVYAAPRRWLTGWGIDPEKCRPEVPRS